MTSSRCREVTVRMNWLAPVEFETGQAVAQQLQRKLEEHQLRSEATESGNIDYWTSGRVRLARSTRRFGRPLSGSLSFHHLFNHTVDIGEDLLLHILCCFRGVTDFETALGQSHQASHGHQLVDRIGRLAQLGTPICPLGHGSRVRARPCRQQ